MDSSCTDFWKLLHGVLRLFKQGLPAKGSPQVVFSVKRRDSLIVCRDYGTDVIVLLETYVLKSRRFSVLREHFAIFQALYHSSLSSLSPELLPAESSAACGMTPSDLHSFQYAINRVRYVHIINPLSASHVLTIFFPSQRIMQHVGRQLLLLRSGNDDVFIDFGAKMH